MEQQTGTQKNQLHVLFLVVILLIIGAGVIFYSLYSKNTKLSEQNLILTQRVSQLVSENNDLTALLDTNKDSLSVDTDKIKNQIYSNLQDKFKINDYTQNIEPGQGYIILSSILSNNKDKVVYLERSTSNYDYNVVVMDLKSGEKSVVYFYKAGVSPNSGACIFEYFPVAWSENDKKIIVEWANTTRFGSECVPQYLSYTIDVKGGDLIDLATKEAIFLDNNLKVAYVDSSKKSPSFCGPGGDENHGSVKIKNIETGEEKTIIEEENSYYNLVGVENNILTYKVKKVLTQSDNCSQFDESVPEFEKTIEIK